MHPKYRPWDSPVRQIIIGPQKHDCWEFWEPNINLFCLHVFFVHERKQKVFAGFPWIHRSMDPWIHGSRHPWIHGSMDGSMDPWIRGSMKILKIFKILQPGPWARPGPWPMGPGQGPGQCPGRGSGPGPGSGQGPGRVPGRGLGRTWWPSFFPIG